jgi:hypothetical protein
MTTMGKTRQAKMCSGGTCFTATELRDIQSSLADLR